LSRERRLLRRVRAENSIRSRNPRSAAETPKADGPLPPRWGRHDRGRPRSRAVPTPVGAVRARWRGFCCSEANPSFRHAHGSAALAPAQTSRAAGVVLLGRLLRARRRVLLRRQRVGEPRHRRALAFPPPPTKGAPMPYVTVGTENDNDIKIYY